MNDRVKSSRPDEQRQVIAAAVVRLSFHLLTDSPDFDRLLRDIGAQKDIPIPLTKLISSEH